MKTPYFKTNAGLLTNYLLMASVTFVVGVQKLGEWECYLTCPGGKIRFGLLLDLGEANTGFITNGEERIKLTDVKFADGQLTISIRHYDSKIIAKIENNQLKGTWRKRRSADDVVELEFVANRGKVESTPSRIRNNNKFTGRWQVNFEKSSDPAVGIFDVGSNGNLIGTFLTTTGDYRYLAGNCDGNSMELSCFDGAHAFLFKARISEAAKLSGEFWSANTWHEVWTAERDQKAQLPDAFKQTKVVQSADWGKFKFPSLDGQPTALNDESFQAKARIIYIFGSWCPNCHDAASYLKILSRRYSTEELNILGLAFELTGDFERDAKQVRRYLNRHESKYPVLVAGISDKALASQTLPFLDRVKSYPTTLFLNSKNEIVAVHTGFTGPADPISYGQLKERFEKILDELIEK